QCLFESWTGFSRSIGLALPANFLNVVLKESRSHSVDYIHWANIAIAELPLAENQEVLYRAGKRFTYSALERQLTTGKTPIRQNGLYLITGGLGSLGLLFANHLAKNYQAILILTGRSSISEEKMASVRELESHGSKVIHLQADICDESKMQRALDAIRARYGNIHGVIHAAGAEGEGTILDRTAAAFKSTLSSKVEGTMLLDELLKDEPLDFVSYFSSTSAILGDFGSCDYSMGNRFQMSYAAYRNNLVAKGLRAGKTVAINWPLWRDGGMNLSEEASTRMYLKSSGQRYLESGEGIELFEQLLAQEGAHNIVMAGIPERIRQMLAPSRPKKIVPVQKSNVTPVTAQPPMKQEVTSKALSTEALEELLEQDLINHVSTLLKIPVDELDIHENLADLGFDSVILTEFASALTKHFDVEVMPALFFSYSTISKLVEYFLDEHVDEIQAIYQKEEQEIANETQAVSQAEVQPSPVAEVHKEVPAQPGKEPIAIIGMSGRFPQSRDIDEMWQIISEGRNAVDEIPADRFDWQEHYGGTTIEEGKTNCKWTGLIPGMKEFDPLFFEISPAEAKLMDPRQRLLLQEAWKALEDAGYGKKHLEENKTALFVGAEEGHYADVAKKAGAITSNHNAILASRLSFFLNLSGPNMAINTACSSGLVAAHQAFQSLQNGECDTALAAGINLMITPEPYVAMSQAGMLSADGTCHTFDKSANGMVPGEAVAVVVMKRLSKAIADGDPIYATIEATGINYDGKTNGITAPSGLAQTELLSSIYDQYHIDPAKLNYIVTHGTGTRLGDPVEINAIVQCID
ncbi:MAG: SDR family NAD(P)-dependent oxidoreductase, partial [Bacteroidota bacterium]